MFTVPLVLDDRASGMKQSAQSIVFIRGKAGDSVLLAVSEYIAFLEQELVNARAGKFSNLKVDVDMGVKRMRVTATLTVLVVLSVLFGVLLSGAIEQFLKSTLPSGGQAVVLLTGAILCGLALAWFIEQRKARRK